MFRLRPLLLIVALLSPIAAAEPSLSVVTPPNQMGPTAVWIGIDDLRIFSIREQDETYELCGRLSMRWLDPRQAFDAQEVGAPRLEYQGEAATDKLDEDVWWPEIEFVDGVGSRDRMAVNLTLDQDGTVWYRERFLVEIKQDFFLEAFPFDQHLISFAVEPFTYGSGAVRLVTNESGVGTANWEPTEWLVEDPVVEVASGVGHVCLGEDGGEEGPFDGGCGEASQCGGNSVCEEVYGFPRMVVSMGIARVSSHYVGNIILPMLLIVLIATAVFWMDLQRTHLGDRLMPRSGSPPEGWPSSPPSPSSAAGCRRRTRRRTTPPPCSTRKWPRGS